MNASGRRDRLARRKRNEIILIGVLDYRHFPVLLPAPCTITTRYRVSRLSLDYPTSSSLLEEWVARRSSSPSRRAWTNAVSSVRPESGRGIEEFPCVIASTHLESLKRQSESRLSSYRGSRTRVRSRVLELHSAKTIFLQLGKQQEKYTALLLYSNDREKKSVVLAGECPQIS